MWRLYVVASLIFASTPLIAAPLPASAAPQAAAAADSSGVDTIVELVKGGMPESLVVKTIQRDGKAYNLGTADLLKLQKAGVSQKIIETMLDPKAGSPASTAAVPAGAVAVVAAQPAAPTAAKATKAEAQPAEKKSGGMLSSLKGKLKDSAQKSVDGVGNTTESAVDKTVTTGQAKVEDAIPSVDDKKTTAAKAAAGKATATTSKK